MDQNEIDIWGQMRFIEHTALGEDWGPFDNRYLNATGFMGYKRVFRPEMKDDFMARITPYCLRVTRDEANIAKANLIWDPVALYGQQRQIYEQVDKHSVLRINGEVIKTPMELTKQVKLQQITSGFILDEDGNVHDVGNAKARRLKFLIAHRLKPPGVIFCCFREELEIVERVVREVSSKVALLHGAVKDKGKYKRRTDLINDFQAGKIDWLICQQRTGGVGIDLYRARNGVFYSFNRSFIDFDQAISRMDVVGGVASTIFLIYAQDTIDEVKRTDILSKGITTEDILNKLKRRNADMAKTEKTEKAVKAKDGEKKKSNLPERPTYKFNVAYLAEKQGIDGSSVRVALRKAGIEKAEGGVYGWNTKAEADAVAAKVWPKEEKKAKKAA